jgi:hypothetical protein
MKFNKRVYSLSLVTVMSLEALVPLAAYADQIDVSLDGLHACNEVVKYKGEVIEGAMCGKRATPEGKVYEYSQFINPKNGLEIVQQWRNEKGQKRTIVIKQEERETVTQSHQEDRYSGAETPYERPAELTNDAEESHTGRNIMIGVGAIAVVGGGVAAYKIGKAKQAREAEREERAYNRGVRNSSGAASRAPGVFSNAPKSIKLDSAYGAHAGTEAKVAGGMRPSDVQPGTPIHTTSSGQQYIVVQNRDTGFLETMLIYDMLTRPYYFHPGYSYFSPYSYGAGGTVVYNNTYVNGDHLYGGSSSSSGSGNYTANTSRTNTTTTYTRESNSGWQNNSNSRNSGNSLSRSQNTGFVSQDTGFVNDNDTKRFSGNSGSSSGSNSGFFSGGNSGGSSSITNSGSSGGSSNSGGGSSTDWAVVTTVGAGTAAAAGLMSPSDSNAAEMRDRKVKSMVSTSSANRSPAVKTSVGELK